MTCGSSTDTRPAALVRWGVSYKYTGSQSPASGDVDWMPSILVDEVKLAAICSSLTGNLQWRLAYRTAATSKSDPGAWSPVTDTNAPYVAGEVNTGDLPVSLGTNMWVQFGIAYSSTSGSGQATLAAALGTRRS